MPTAYKPLIFLNFSKFYNYTPTKGKRHDVGRAFFLWPEDGTCSGEMNSPCAEGLGTAQTPRDGVPDAAGPVGRGWGYLAGETDEHGGTTWVVLFFYFTHQASQYIPCKRHGGLPCLFLSSRYSLGAIRLLT